MKEVISGLLVRMLWSTVMEVFLRPQGWTLFVFFQKILHDVCIYDNVPFFLSSPVFTLFFLFHYFKIFQLWIFIFSLVIPAGEENELLVGIKYEGNTFYCN